MPSHKNNNHQNNNSNRWGYHADIECRRGQGGRRDGVWRGGVLRAHVEVKWRGSRTVYVTTHVATITGRPPHTSTLPSPCCQPPFHQQNNHQQSPGAYFAKDSIIPFPYPLLAQHLLVSLPCQVYIVSPNLPHARRGMGGEWKGGGGA